jgi:hypothetical protein
MKNEHQRFRQMKKDLDLKNSDIAEITGNKEAGIKNATQPNKPLPRNLKLAIHVHEHHMKTTVSPLNKFIDQQKES